MTEVPMEWSGAVTIVALIALGVFLYPWLLRRRGGAAFVAGGTVALAVLFYWFDRRAGTSPNLLLAVLWALLPVAVGITAWWFSRRRSST